VRLTNKLVTPKQVAQAIGVSESSLKRWCDRGILSTVRTAGGHRRLALESVFEFLRKSGQPLVRPELLGLPSNTGQSPTVPLRAREQMFDALMTGDDDQCRRIVFDLYLSGKSACDICDGVLAPALHEIGARWQCGDVAIYRERRACEIASKTLSELRLAILAPSIEAPMALGATLERDPYRLPTEMIEVVMRELGWNATSLGTQLPAATLIQAVRDSQPRLLWVSVSCVESIPEFLDEYAKLQRAATEVNSVVVVGGRALTADIRQRITYAAYCDTLNHLAAFATSLTSNSGRKHVATRSKIDCQAS